MLNRLNPHTASIAMAALVTAVTLSSLGALANREYRHAAYAEALLAQADAPVALEQIVVVGRKVQQVVVVGHRRG